jgi:thioredoxin 1
MFAPVFERASQHHNDIVFGKVDTEVQIELARPSASRRSPR